MQKKGNSRIDFVIGSIMTSKSKRSNSRSEFAILNRIAPNSKRSQAAMEFLMTYGWAILAAIIAIGVLAYFGVFSPGNYMSNIVTINQPFGTTQELAIKPASVSFVLRNGGGSSADITSIAVAGCGTDAVAKTIADGASQLITVTCLPVLVSDDKFKGDVTIIYRIGEKVMDLTGTGSISGRVE